MLPALNASLNTTAAVLLVVGLVLVKGGHRRAHGWTMGAAFGVSAAFLVSYLYYHFRVVPEVGHTPFNGAGWTRSAYYALLLSHVVLAIVNLPLVLRVLWLAKERDWRRHRRLARWAWPIWFYVSVTGVLVYFALYRWNPESV